MYGSWPMLLDVRAGGLAHGILLMNSNGMDVTLSEDRLTYRAIGGVLDFYVFMGPTPNDVVDQLTQVVGELILELFLLSRCFSLRRRSRSRFFRRSSSSSSSFSLSPFFVCQGTRNFLSLTFIPSISSRICFCCSRNESRTMSEPAGAEAPPSFLFD